MNRLSEAVKYLLLCASILITCGLIALGFLISKQAQSMGHTVSHNMNDFNRDMTYSNITKYDGLTVSGSDVINFTKKYLGNVTISDIAPFDIKVVTIKKSTIYRDKVLLSQINNFSSEYYIKPTSTFLGGVVINKNGVITEVNFIQK